VTTDLGIQGFNNYPPLKPKLPPGFLNNSQTDNINFGDFFNSGKTTDETGVNSNDKPPKPPKPPKPASCASVDCSA